MLASPSIRSKQNAMKPIGLFVGLFGVLLLLLASVGLLGSSGISLGLSLASMSLGVLIYSLGQHGLQQTGIDNNGIFFNSLSARGWVAWLIGIVVTAFYVCLYLKASWIGLGTDGNPNTGLIGFFDPLSYWMKGKPASQWFVYGTLYTLAILIFGFKYILKYRHNRYQIFRTISVMCFQLFFAYLIPEVLEMLHPDTATNYFAKDLKNMWPLNYYFFEEWHIRNMSKGALLGNFFLIFGLAMIFVISPILTYLYGKRWYCSWVCGCGGLAETAGDAFRHLSDKSLRAWKIERWMIHLVLLFSVVMTVAVVFGYLNNNPGVFLLSKTSFTIIVIVLLILLGTVYAVLDKKSVEENSKVRYIVLGTLISIILVLLINYISGSSNAFFLNNYAFKSFYALYIGSIFSGIIGVGFYPILGSRVWCRFGCPMAALLGIQQKLLSRFRITTNGSQCISCGNCSTYCEMGIDVRAYAQKGQNIVRSSCVGCGVCSAVCPRGVLRLENGSLDLFSKTEQQRNVHVLESEVTIL